MLNLLQLPLEAQVAQLFMIGYEGLTPNTITQRFLKQGVGGLIFFRDNFEGLPTAEAVATQLKSLADAIPNAYPRPFLGIDQEGGQVERLPHRLFPTLLTPRAVALAPNSLALAHTVYTTLANHLRALGFNLNFFPTLDVNLNPKNPIIGVRSFGDTPKIVWQHSQIALEAFQKAGLIAVGKHFPGHGNGTVDSHLDLPTLTFTPQELQPFQQAIQADLPAMLVAHGFYPALQSTPAEKMLPSSASPAIIQGLLRRQCGFQGLVITDDMCMGAITQHKGAVTAALDALRAGVDILLYKQSTEAEWAVYEAVLQAFKQGELPINQLHESLSRIEQVKNQYLQGPFSIPFPEAFSPEAYYTNALSIAEKGISLLAGDPACLPLNAKQSILLVHPQRENMGNYAFDIPTSLELPALIQANGSFPLEAWAYPVGKPFSPEAWMEQIVTASPDLLVLVSFNPLLNPQQAELFQRLRARYPQARLVLISAGTPYCQQVLPAPDLHLGLCSYRPASMQALANRLTLKATP